MILDIILNVIRNIENSNIFQIYMFLNSNAMISFWFEG